MGTLVSTQVNTIDGYVLTERTITADKIVAHAITANEIASKTITANEILAGTITGSEIAANAIDAGHIKAGAITTSKVSSDFGDTLDLSGNQGVTIRVESAVHDAISGMELGGRNYVLSADVENASSEYNIHQYKLSTPMTAGEKYTLTLCCTPAAGVASIRPYVSGGYYCLCTLDVTETGRQILKKTFTAGYYAGRTPEDDETNGDVAFFRFPNDGKGKRYCHGKKIPEAVLKALVADVLELPCYEAPEMEAQVDHIEVPADNHLKFYLRDGRVEERTWKDRSRRESWTPEMKEKARQNAMKRKR